METQTTGQSAPNIKHLPASPHGEFDKVFEGIWFIRGGIKMPMMMPMKIGRSMTVVAGDNGELTIFNSMRLSEEGLRSLDALGRVANIVRIGGFHGRDDAFYKDRYGARVFAIEGQRYVREMDNGNDKFTEYLQPDVWLNERSNLPIADAKLKIFSSSNPPEGVVLLQRQGGILISGDSLQHSPQPDEYFNFPAKLMMKKFCFFKPHNVGPGWLQFAKPKASDVRSVMDLDFEHVLPGHGKPVIGGAKEHYRTAIEGELKGCHE